MVGSRLEQICNYFRCPQNKSTQRGKIVEPCRRYHHKVSALRWVDAIAFSLDCCLLWSRCVPHFCSTRGFYFYFSLRQYDARPKFLPSRQQNGNGRAIYTNPHELKRFSARWQPLSRIEPAFTVTVLLGLVPAPTLGEKGERTK